MMPAPEVRQAALPQPGGVISARAKGHPLRGFLWVEQLLQDMRYGCRMLAKNPGFTVVAVMSLAIGIGANCAIFSWSDALLLRPLAVPRPSEVLTVGSTTPIPPSSAGTCASTESSSPSSASPRRNSPG